MRVRIGMLAASASLTLSAVSPAVDASARDTAPGDLVSAEPSAFHPLPGRPSASAAWKIHYRSTSATGEPNVVSGTVIVPEDGRTGPRPLISYAFGTLGLADPCAPSANLPKGGLAEGGLVDRLLRRGWAVVVTDYEGLGTPGEHTYTVGRSAGRAVLDAARAAIRLPQAGLSAESPVGIVGYSQGGQAAGWAAELHSSYAPELRVKGTATGGVPARLEELPEIHDGSSGAGLLLMMAAGQDAAFPELKLDSYLNADGRTLVQAVRSNCLAIDTTVGAYKKMSDLTVKNPLSTPAWRNRLHESDLGTRAPGSPVYLYHATGDELVPYDQGTGLRRSWCARGGNVHWRAVLLGGHASGVVTESASATAWLAERFAGRRTAGNC
ncbi:lipase family protein [Streptomyces sp. SP18CS02]|uniref:lipase family protein n=1 Tax=Streptomyces sp. SP18CS02 TaxID=3002531 RepID=UPI002E7A1034|nr:lipase family protein [Streptomyces sp. SP18CS02]MEE1751831.1 lipase family protein [Streptomyces sp. SP18CS02]